MYPIVKKEKLADKIYQLFIYNEQLINIRHTD